MLSIRKAATCLGLSGPFSTIFDFYGYRIGKPVTLSLRTQLRLLQGKHIHLNLIRTADIDLDHLKEIDYGLQLMRNIYATVNVGVGRIQRFSIPPGYEVIDGYDEAEDLWNEFSVPNSAIDLFLARVIVGDSVGMSRVGGACDKDSKNDSGCVVGVEDNEDDLGLTIGQAMAHEVGHYLGLQHEEHLEDNLMYTTVLNGGKLYGGQGGVMVLHCLMQGGCVK